MVFTKKSLVAFFLVAVAIPAFGGDDLHPNDLKGQKPRIPAAFREDCAVVPVSWSVPEGRAARKTGKPSSAGLDFAETDVSVLSISSSLPQVSDAPKTVVNQEVIAELNQLLSVNEAKPVEERVQKSAAQNLSGSEAGLSYLQELQELGKQDSSWVLLNRQYAASQEKEVKESLPSYLSELGELDRRIESLRPLINRPAVRQEVVVSLVRQEAAGSEMSLSELFRSVKDVKIGVVPEPVTLSKAAQEASASQFMSKTGPTYYTTPVRLSVRRPNRMLYPFRNNPLYFEDPNLERCGLSHGCLTEVSSIGRFAFNTVILPYRVAAEPPHLCVPSLGDCPTCNEFDSTAGLPPWSWRGAVAEAGVVTGLIFVIP